MSPTRWIWMEAASDVAAQRREDAIELLLADVASIGDDLGSSLAVLELGAASFRP